MSAIDVTGLDLWELLAALHNASRVSPTMVCWVQEKGDNITAEQAREESQAGVSEDYRFINAVPFWSDYLFGRPIKVNLRKTGNSIFLTRAEFYDRDVGPGACARVVTSLRNKAFLEAVREAGEATRDSLEPESKEGGKKQ